MSHDASKPSHRRNEGGSGWPFENVSLARTSAAIGRGSTISISGVSSAATFSMTRSISAMPRATWAWVFVLFAMRGRA